MSSAGQLLEAGRIPGEVIGTPSIVTSDSSPFTTSDTEVMTITVPLIAGRTYQVWFLGRFNTDAADTKVACEMHQDNDAGTLMQIGQTDLPNTSTLGYGPLPVTALFEAVTSANKTFVITGRRNGGTGNIRLDASPAAPAFLWVEYFSG
jgi:hypothetical protein